MATNNKLKELVGSIGKTVECAASALGLDDSDLSNAVKCELGMFMMYLSASDGEIKWSEASFISDLCDLNLTPQTIGDFIRDKNIYSTEFENDVPVSLTLLVAMDNKIVDAQMADEVSDGAEALIEVYKIIAAEMIKSDGDVDENEKNDARIYLSMLENYHDDNSKRIKSSVSGFVKNSGSVSVPTKSGVSAPRKKG